jgi:UDP-2,3-diacylglucosamine pyrophosphatase LpxH
MLVFASDIHLTDGSSGTTINAGAFKKFVDSVILMADRAGAKSLDVVFLGDIIDLIRSATWLGTSIRPWSDENETDKLGKQLKDYAIKITNDICTRSANAACTQHLARLKQVMSSKGVPVTISYITGNHDWLVNRYPDARKLAVDFLQLDNDWEKAFDVQGKWNEYGVFARHGDIYDDFNYDGKSRDASSLGDAIVIELLNKFPLVVEKELGSKVKPEFIHLLKEIDNVRPLTDAPLWVVAACEQTQDKALADEVQRIWDDTVDKFLSIKFVRQHNHIFDLADPFDKIRAALRLSEWFKLGPLARILENPIIKIFQEQSNLVDKAAQENSFQKGQVDFILYGHTHYFGIWPIGKFIKTGEVLRQSYINTGTWRMVFEHGKHAMFSGWDVMTFVCFYLTDERGERLFEVWSGALA